MEKGARVEDVMQQDHEELCGFLRCFNRLRAGSPGPKETRSSYLSYHLRYPPEFALKMPYGCELCHQWLPTDLGAGGC
jgi:hypothetical protein